MTVETRGDKAVYIKATPTTAASNGRVERGGQNVTSVDEGVIWPAIRRLHNKALALLHALIVSLSMQN
ncbi:hypothetical protein E2C01_077412 [Portunus trituberculatus]|uniref:Uncharacterized protein n=1 Tax=Portunus trituberculatus TaxID=210409 RepID=A0A5B7IED4_PORTR|nr:hypothetical protein [Portunus trituberculatus]